MIHSNLLLASNLADLHYKLDVAIWLHLKARLNDENVFIQVVPKDWYAEDLEDSPFKVNLMYNLDAIYRQTGPSEQTQLYLNRQLLRPVDFIQAISEPVPTEQYKRRVSKHRVRELNRLSHVAFDELPASLQLTYVNEAMFDVIKLHSSTDKLYLYPKMASFIRCTEGEIMT